MLPLILVFAIIFGMLSISFYYLYNAYQASLQDNSEGVLFNALLGSVGIGVSIYMTRIITKRSFSKKPLPKIVTTTECTKCGFKRLNKFEEGDYVFKSVGECQECNEPMLITAIYAEETKKK